MIRTPTSRSVSQTSQVGRPRRAPLKQLKKESKKPTELQLMLMKISREREKSMQSNSGKRKSENCGNLIFYSRAEMFKQKRAFVGEGGTNTPAMATAQTQN